MKKKSRGHKFDYVIYDELDTINLMELKMAINKIVKENISSVRSSSR
jgi:hypothetical protein